MSDYDKRVLTKVTRVLTANGIVEEPAREARSCPDCSADSDMRHHPSCPSFLNTSRPEPKVQGLKYDQEKSPLSLISRRWLTGVADVMGFGAKKYAAHNWRGGIERSRLISAALRHILAYNEGEDTDPETGLSHLDHASCCLMFARELHETRPDLDDRYKGKK